MFTCHIEEVQQYGISSSFRDPETMSFADSAIDTMPCETYGA